MCPAAFKCVAALQQQVHNSSDEVSLLQMVAAEATAEARCRHEHGCAV
jgi:hypothetical protein